LAVAADIVRPSMTWLVSGGSSHGGVLVRNLAAWRDPDGFARLAARCDSDPGVSVMAKDQTLYRAAMILAAKGGTLGEITVGDVVELLDAERDRRAHSASGRALLYRMLHEMGILDAMAPPSLRALRTSGQRSPEELIDRYCLRCSPVRDLLVDYLRERQPALDYTSLEALAYYLGKLFWSDLERHHPGIDSLRLPVEVAIAWKRRLKTVRKTTTAVASQKAPADVARINYRECLTPVRAFYLDLAHWAVDDPGRWGPWVAPCPIGAEELSRKKGNRQRKSRMDARTRERLPVLPVVIRSVNERRKTAKALLETARGVEPGDAFSFAGATLARSVVGLRCDTDKVWVDDPVSGKRRDLGREEDHAFWAWAIVEVLRATGARSEELLELSHHSLVQYRLPTTGEVIPLLQIVPSKTDAERLLVVSPELADVLGAIIVRVSGGSGAVPLVAAYDTHERLWLPPAPLLFQRRVGTENRALSSSAVRHLLSAALTHSGLVDHADGRPLRYTPHDFRRIIITDAILNGLPPPHRSDHRRPPGHQRHPGLQGGLPRGGDPGPARLPRSATFPAPQRRVPHADRPGMARVLGSLRAATGVHRDLRPRLRHRLHSRARLCSLPDAVARPEPTGPCGRHRRQPHRPYRRSRTRRLARRGRWTSGQPGRRRGQARPDRPTLPARHHCGTPHTQTLNSITSCSR
jgi:hypothetical protein